MAVVVKQTEAKISLTHFALPMFCLLIIINGLFAFSLSFNAEWLAQFIGDRQLAPAFEKVAFVFWLIPLTALLRGMFQSQLHMQPIAYSQVSEQIVRVLIILATAILYASGKLTNIYKIAEWAAYAALLASSVAMIVLLIFLFKDKRFTKETFAIPWKQYIYTIIVFGVIVSLNHMILLLTQLADTLTLIPALENFGLTKNAAMIYKGTFDRGQPLIQLGTVIGSSFALTLIPAATEQQRQKNPLSTRSITEALTFSFYLAVGATIGLCLIFPETNLLLFRDMSGTFSLQVLSLAIILSTMSVTAIAVLQGLGVVIRTALYILLAFIVKWISNLLLVPVMSITGSALATVISLLFLTGLVFYELKKKFPLHKLLKDLRWKRLVIAAFSMIIYIDVVKWITPISWYVSRLFLLLYVMFIVILEYFLYYILFVICY